jgi:lipooligosaccharide transport system permease protein
VSATTTFKPRRYGSWYVAEHRFLAMRAYGQTILATSIGNPVVYLFALGVGLASTPTSARATAAG